MDATKSGMHQQHMTVLSVATVTAIQEDKEEKRFVFPQRNLAFKGPSD